MPSQSDDQSCRISLEIKQNRSGSNFSSLVVYLTLLVVEARSKRFEINHVTDDRIVLL